MHGLGVAADREPDLFTELRQSSPRFRRALDLAGIPHMHNPSHIVPVMVGDAALCKAISDQLMERGIYIQPINYPTVPVGQERLRVTPTPGHVREYREHLVEAFDAVWKQLGIKRTSEWAADMGDGLRTKAKVKPRSKAVDEADKVRGLDRKLARGNALTTPYAIATVTVPKTARISEYGRALDSAIRRAGFAPLRLDLSQDVAFAASTIPLGVSLTRKGSS